MRTSDGVEYRVRPIRPDDAQREREFIAGLSPQSRYQRFLHNLREPGDALIAQLVHVDGHDDFYHPGNYDSARRLGAVAGMDLALASGGRLCQRALPGAD